MEELRAYIRELMHKRGIKAIEIQERSGGEIKDAYISDILRGKTKSPGIEKLNALAKGLDVDGAELFKIASGKRLFVKADNPWSGRDLVRAMEKIMDSADLTAIVRELVDLKPSRVKAVRKFIESGKS